MLNNALGGTANEQPGNRTTTVRSDDDQIHIEMVRHEDDLIKRISDPKVRLDLDSLLRQLFRECFKAFSCLLLGGIDLRLNLGTVLPSACVWRHHVVRYLEDVQKVDCRAVAGSSFCSVGDGPFGMLRKVNRNKNFIVGEVIFIRRGFRAIVALGGSA